MNFQYLWASGVRVESENWSNIGQKTESKSTCLLASIFDRFLLDFGTVLGGQNRPKSDRNNVRQKVTKHMPKGSQHGRPGGLRCTPRGPARRHALGQRGGLEGCITPAKVRMQSENHAKSVAKEFYARFMQEDLCKSVDFHSARRAKVRRIQTLRAFRRCEAGGYQARCRMTTRRAIGGASERVKKPTVGGHLAPSVALGGS